MSHAVSSPANRVRSRDSCFVIRSSDIGGAELQQQLDNDSKAWSLVIDALLTPHKNVQYLCIYLQAVDKKLQIRGYCYLAHDNPRCMRAFSNYIGAEHNKPDRETRMMFTGDNISFDDLVLGPFRVGVPPRPGRRSDFNPERKEYMDIPTLPGIRKNRIQINAVLPHKKIASPDVVDIVKDTIFHRAGGLSSPIFIHNGNNWAHYNGETEVISVNSSRTKTDWKDFANGYMTYVPYFRARIRNRIETVWIILDSLNIAKHKLPVRTKTYIIEDGLDGNPTLIEGDYHECS